MIQHLFLLHRWTWPAAETFLPPPRGFSWSVLRRRVWLICDPCHLESVLYLVCTFSLISLRSIYIFQAFSAPGWQNETLNLDILLSMPKVVWAIQCFCRTAWRWTGRFSLPVLPEYGHTDREVIHNDVPGNFYQDGPTPPPTAISCPCSP